MLLLLQNSPITLDTNLRVEADFSLHPAVYNLSAIFTMFPEGTTMEDLRRLIRDSVLGNWTCTASNSFGNDSVTSRVSGQYCRDVLCFGL